MTSAATVLGDIVSFTTLNTPKAPTVLVHSATMIMQTSASVGGEITTDGGADVTDRGIYYGTSSGPETGGTKISSGTGTGVFSAAITGLSGGTKYYFKPYAVNSLGQGLGREISFTTPAGSDCISCETGTDQGYKTIKIGNQIWMAENLRTATFASGATIPSSAYTVVITDSNPVYQWAGGCDDASVKQYGMMYTWFAVADSRGLCPSGWHVASDAEFQTLEDFLGGPNLAGGKMKSVGTTIGGDGLYNDPNRGATNESGFSGNPNAYFDTNCKCNSCADASTNPSGASYWTTTEFSPGSMNAYSRGLDAKTSTLGSGTVRKHFGLAVRCVKN